MLFYLRVIAGGQKTLSVNLQPTDDVSKIREFLAVREPDLIVQNVLFAGRVLQDNTPLSQYDIHKECTVQVMGRRRPNAGEEAKAAAAAAPKAGGALAPPGPLVRQVTAEPLQYGDALIVNVLEARNLMAMDYWSGKSDPYVILTVGKGSAQTSVISKEVSWGGCGGGGGGCCCCCCCGVARCAPRGSQLATRRCSSTPSGTRRLAF
jgi:hypothetical protein